MAPAALQMRARKIHAQERSVSGSRRSCSYSAAPRHVGNSLRAVIRRAGPWLRTTLSNSAHAFRGLSTSLRAQRSNPFFLSCRDMDCFAALAMTPEAFETCSRSRGTICVRGLHEPFPSSKSEGAGNAGCLLHPRSRVQCCAERCAHEHTGTAESTPAFPAQGSRTGPEKSRQINGVRLLCSHLCRDPMSIWMRKETWGHIDAYRALWRAYAARRWPRAATQP